MTETVQEAERLADAGRYRHAVTMLVGAKRQLNRDALLLQAELLEIVGETDSAQLLLDDLLSSRHLADTDRSRAEFVLSRIAAENGQFTSELNHLQRSLTHAERAH